MGVIQSNLLIKQGNFQVRASLINSTMKHNRNTRNVHLCWMCSIKWRIQKNFLSTFSINRYLKAYFNVTLIHVQLSQTNTAYPETSNCKLLKLSNKLTKGNLML